MYFVNLTTQLFYFSDSETFTYSCVPWQCFSSCNNENGFASTVSWFSRSIFKLLFISFCWDLIDLLKAAQPYLGIFCSQNVSLLCTNEGWGCLSKRWRPIQQWASHLYTVDFSTTKHFINRERMNVPIMLILSRHLSVWLPRVSNSRVCEHSQGKNNRPTEGPTKPKLWGFSARCSNFTYSKQYAEVRFCTKASLSFIWNHWGTIFKPRNVANQWTVL